MQYEVDMDVVTYSKATRIVEADSENLARELAEDEFLDDAPAEGHTEVTGSHATEIKD